MNSHWPTDLDANGIAPANIFLVADGDEHVRRQALYQVQVAVHLKDRGYEPDGLQVPLVGPKTRITMPILATDPGGRSVAVYTQAEEWTPERLLDMRNWMMQLDEVSDVPIVVASRVSSPPLKPIPRITLIHLPYPTLDRAPDTPDAPVEQTPPAPVDAALAAVLPCLKARDWIGTGEAVCRPLWDGQQSDQMPWVAFGLDHPAAFQFIKRSQLAPANTSVSALETQALANLRARPAEWEPVIAEIENGSPLQMLVCSGDFFAAERILDPEFMVRAQQTLAATAILAGVPRRGVLFATDGNQEPERLMAFARAVTAQFARAESPEISPLLFGIKDGVVVGVAETMAPITPARPAESSVEPLPVEDAAEDPNAPFLTTITAANESGKEDVHLLAGGVDGLRLAKAIETEFAAVLATQLGRKEFSGHVQLVFLPMTPPSERKHLTAIVAQLKETCATLSAAGTPCRVSVTYQRDTFSAPGAATPAAAMPAAKPITFSGPRAPRVAGGWQTRLWSTLGVGLVVAAVYVGRDLTAPYAVTLPDRVDFGQQSLNKATSWTRNGISGAVYVAPDEKLPTAPLQVGVMVSTEHQTAAQMDAWIRGEYNRSNTQRYYDTEPGDVSCKAGLASYRDDARAFMAVQVCKNGDGKAACAEADEIMPETLITQCVNGPSSCFAEACAMRERDDAGWLSLLVQDALKQK